MTGPAGEAKRRLDLVHLLNSQASTWRAPLAAPPVRPSDGLAADSPMGWQGIPWWRHVGVPGGSSGEALGRAGRRLADGLARDPVVAPRGGPIPGVLGRVRRG